MFSEFFQIVHKAGEFPLHADFDLSEEDEPVQEV